VVLTTDKFEELARSSADQSGLSSARIVAVAHPVGGVSRGEIEGRADAVVEDVMHRLLGRPDRRAARGPESGGGWNG